jgi:DNA gyrase subunit A
MVQRTGVEGISQMGRSTQGVKVMNIKDDDRVSAVALAAESDDDAVPLDGEPVDQVEIEGESAIDDGAAEDEGAE